MATGRYIDDEYREQLTCGICLDIVKIPKSLQCTHTFCAKCLDGWINTNRGRRNRKFPCPTCKDLNIIPQNGANAYKTNVMVQGIVDIIDRQLKLNEENTVDCDICIHYNIYSPAMGRCVECAENMCQACKRAHGRSRASKSHRLYDLTGNAYEDSKTALAHLPRRNIDCPAHPDQPLIFFCMGDKVPVCRDCCITEHSKHDCVKIETLSEAEKERITALVKLIKEKKLKYEWAINCSVYGRQTQKHKMQATLNEINVSRKEQLERVNTHFDSLESKVKECDEANDKKIQAHQNGLTLQKGIADSTILHLSTLQKHGHPVEIINASRDISEKLREWTETQEINLGSLSEQTFEKGHIETSKLGHIVSRSIAVQAPTLCQPKVLYKRHIAKRFSEKSAIWDASVGAGLVVTACLTESLTQLTVYDNDALTPKHQTLGSFNGVCALPGNQYAATDFRKGCIAIFNDKLVHQRNIGRFEDPCGICCNSMNELIVSDLSTKKVYRIKISDGSKLAATPPGLFHTPHSVSCNNKGVVIVSDVKTHSITGITRHGDSVFSYGKRGSGDGQLNHPGGVCTDVLNNIIVADEGNNRVHLLDSSGRFVRYILTAGDGLQGPYTVAIGKYGDLVIGTAPGDVWFVKYMNYQ